VTSLGVLSAGVLMEDLGAYGGSVDNIIPTVITASLPPVLAGIAIIGPVAASISTVSSLLISSSSAIIKDVYLHWCDDRGRAPSQRSVALSSQAVTLAVGLLVFVLSIAAGRHLEDQHAPSAAWNGVSVRARLRVVLEGPTPRALCFARRRHVGLLRRHGRGLQSGRFAPDRHRRDGSRRPHGGGNARWQAERRRPHGRLLPDGLGPRSVNTARPDPFRDPGALLL
ncbi:MAG: sodium:solute symporter family transporter, partial [Adlercreutzia sp.]